MNEIVNLSAKKICFDFSNSTPYKCKKDLIELAKRNGIEISFGINKTIDYLLKDDGSDLETLKCRTAFKLNIPVLKANFLYNEKKSFSLDEFLLRNKKFEKNITEGKIGLLNSKLKNLD